MELRRVLEPGSVLHGRYRIEEALREDASGRRYTAVCSVTRKRVIVKSLTPHGVEPQNRAATFRRLGEAVARLRHPALARVLACVEDEGFFIVLDSVEGRRLSEVLDEEHVGLVQALFWIDEILALLAFMHSQTPPILARVIEPEHFVVNEEGHMVLDDVALAGFIAPAAPSRYYPAGRDTSDDPRYDLYSVGALFYTMLKLEIPAGPVVETPGRRTPAFDTLIRALVHPDVGQRYATAVDAQRALRPFRERVLRLYGPPNDGDLSNSGRRRSGADTDVRPHAGDAATVNRHADEPRRKIATSVVGETPSTAQLRPPPPPQPAPPKAASSSAPPPHAPPRSGSPTKTRTAPSAPSKTDRLAPPLSVTSRQTDKQPPLSPAAAAKQKAGAIRGVVALLIIACCALGTWLLWPSREPTAAAITLAGSPSERSPLPQSSTAPEASTAPEVSNTPEASPAPEASAAPETTPMSDASKMPSEATPVPAASGAPSGEPAAAASPAPRTTPATPCVVAVDSTPPNAWVKIDGGQRVGQTPCRVTLQPRSTPYKVMISKQGYLPGSALVTTKRAQASVKISLQPAPPPATAPPPAPAYRPAPYRPPVYYRPRPAAPPPPRPRERIQLPD